MKRAEMYEGTVQLYSEIGKGSMLSVKFPLNATGTVLQNQ